jgi:tRNA(Ile)-lysidine synthase
VAHTMRNLIGRLDREVASGAHDIIRKDEKGRVVLDLKNLDSAPPYLHDEYLLRALKEASAPISTEKVLQLRDLWIGQSGRRLDLSRTAIAVKQGHELVLGPPEIPAEFAYPVELGSEYAFEAFSFSAKPLSEPPDTLPRSGDRAVIDGSALGHSLTIRSWRPGDWFTPLGMRGRKKVSDFFTDQKIPQERRSLFPVLESDGSIVWICGLRLDERAKVTPSTTRWVELFFHHHA